MIPIVPTPPSRYSEIDVQHAASRAHQARRRLVPVRLPPALVHGVRESPIFHLTTPRARVTSKTTSTIKGVQLSDKHSDSTSSFGESIASLPLSVAQSKVSSQKESIAAQQSIEPLQAENIMSLNLSRTSSVSVKPDDWGWSQQHTVDLADSERSKSSISTEQSIRNPEFTENALPVLNNPFANLPVDGCLVRLPLPETANAWAPARLIAIDAARAAVLLDWINDEAGEQADSIVLGRVPTESPDGSSLRVLVWVHASNVALQPGQLEWLSSEMTHNQTAAVPDSGTEPSEHSDSVSRTASDSQYDYGSTTQSSIIESSDPDLDSGQYSNTSETSSVYRQRAFGASSFDNPVGDSLSTSFLRHEAASLHRISAAAQVFEASSNSNVTLQPSGTSARAYFTDLRRISGVPFLHEMHLMLPRSVDNHFPITPRADGKSNLLKPWSSTIRRRLQSASMLDWQPYPDEEASALLDPTFVWSSLDDSSCSPLLVPQSALLAAVVNERNRYDSLQISHLHRPLAYPPAPKASPSLDFSSSAPLPAFSSIGWIAAAPGHPRLSLYSRLGGDPRVDVSWLIMLMGADVSPTFLHHTPPPLQPQYSGMGNSLPSSKLISSISSSSLHSRTPSQSVLHSLPLGFPVSSHKDIISPHESFTNPDGVDASFWWCLPDDPSRFKLPRSWSVIPLPPSLRNEAGRSRLTGDPQSSKSLAASFRSHLINVLSTHASNFGLMTWSPPQATTRAASIEADRIALRQELALDSSQWPNTIMTEFRAHRIANRVSDGLLFSASIDSQQFSQMLSECADCYLATFQLLRIGQLIPFSPRLVPSFVPIPPPPRGRLLTFLARDNRQSLLTSTGVRMHASVLELFNALTQSKLLGHPALLCSSAFPVQFTPLFRPHEFPSLGSRAEAAAWVSTLNSSILRARSSFLQWRNDILAFLERFRFSILSEPVPTPAPNGGVSIQNDSFNSVGQRRWLKTLRLLDLMGQHLLFEWSRAALENWISIFFNAEFSAVHPSRLLLFLSLHSQSSESSNESNFPVNISISVEDALNQIKEFAYLLATLPHSIGTFSAHFAPVVAQRTVSFHVAADFAELSYFNTQPTTPKVSVHVDRDSAQSISSTDVFSPLPSEDRVCRDFQQKLDILGQCYQSHLSTIATLYQPFTSSLGPLLLNTRSDFSLRSLYLSHVRQVEALNNRIRMQRLQTQLPQLNTTQQSIEADDMDADSNDADETVDHESDQETTQPESAAAAEESDAAATSATSADSVSESIAVIDTTPAIEDTKDDEDINVSDVQAVQTLESSALDPLPQILNWLNGASKECSLIWKLIERIERFSSEFDISSVLHLQVEAIADSINQFKIRGYFGRIDCWAANFEIRRRLEFKLRSVLLAVRTRESSLIRTIASSSARLMLRAQAASTGIAAAEAALTSKSAARHNKLAAVNRNPKGRSGALRASAAVSAVTISDLISLRQRCLTDRVAFIECKHQLDAALLIRNSVLSSRDFEVISESASAAICVSNISNFGQSQVFQAMQDGVAEDTQRNRICASLSLALSHVDNLQLSVLQAIDQRAQQLWSNLDAQEQQLIQRIQSLRQQIQSDLGHFQLKRTNPPSSGLERIEARVRVAKQNALATAELSRLLAVHLEQRALFRKSNLEEVTFAQSHDLPVSAFVAENSSCDVAQSQAIVELDALCTSLRFYSRFWSFCYRVRANLHDWTFESHAAQLDGALISNHICKFWPQQLLQLSDYLPKESKYLIEQHLSSNEFHVRNNSKQFFDQLVSWYSLQTSDTVSVIDFLFSSCDSFSGDISSIPHDRVQSCSQFLLNFAQALVSFQHHLLHLVLMVSHVALSKSHWRNINSVLGGKSIGLNQLSLNFEYVPEFLHSATEAPFWSFDELLRIGLHRNISTLSEAMIQSVLSHEAKIGIQTCALELTKLCWSPFSESEVNCFHSDAVGVDDTIQFLDDISDSNHQTSLNYAPLPVQIRRVNAASNELETINSRIQQHSLFTGGSENEIAQSGPIFIDVCNKWSKCQHFLSNWLQFQRTKANLFQLKQLFDLNCVDLRIGFEQAQLAWSNAESFIKSIFQLKTRLSLVSVVSQIAENFFHDCDAASKNLIQLIFSSGSELSILTLHRFPRLGFVSRQCALDLLSTILEFSLLPQSPAPSNEFIVSFNSLLQLIFPGIKCAIFSETNEKLILGVQSHDEFVLKFDQSLSPVDLCNGNVKLSSVFDWLQNFELTILRNNQLLLKNTLNRLCGVLGAVPGIPVFVRTTTIVNEIEAFDSWAAHPATPQLAAALLNALVFTSSSVATVAADIIFTRLIDAATGAKPLNHQSNNTEEYEVDPDHDDFGGEDRPLNLSLKRIKNAIAAKRQESAVSSTRRRLQEALTNDQSLNASDSNSSEDPQSRLKRARSVLAALLICHARHEAIVKVLLSERVEEITNSRVEQVQSADLRKSNRSNSISQNMFVKPNLTAALSSALSTAVTTTIVPHFAWRSQYRYNASSLSDDRWLDSLIVASIIPVKFWSQQFEKDNTTSKFPIFHRQELLFSVDFSVGSHQFSYAYELPLKCDSHFVFTPSNTKTLLALANAASSCSGKQSVPGTLPSLMGGPSTGKRSMIQQFSRLAGRPLFNFSCKDLIASDSVDVTEFNLISSLSMVLQCTEGMSSSSSSLHSNISRPWLCISDLEVLPPLLMSQFASIVQSCCISHDSRKHYVKGAFFLTDNSVSTASDILHVPLPASLSTCLRCVQTVRPDLSVIFSAQLCASGFSRFADIGLRLAALFGDLNALSALNLRAPPESQIVSLDQKFRTSPLQHNILNLVLSELMPRLLSARGPFSSGAENCEEDVAVAMCLHRMFCERLADSPMDMSIFDSALMRAFPAASRANFRDASIAWTALSMSHVDSVSLETNMWDGFAAETDPSSTALRVMLAQSAEQRYQATGSSVSQISSDPQHEIDLLLSSSSSITSSKYTPIDFEGRRDIVSALVFLQNSTNIPTSSEWTQFLRQQFDSDEEPVTLHPLIHQLKRPVRPNALPLKSAPRSIQVSEPSKDDKIHFRRIFSNLAFHAAKVAANSSFLETIEDDSSPALKSHNAVVAAWSARLLALVSPLQPHLISSQDSLGIDHLLGSMASQISTAKQMTALRTRVRLCASAFFRTRVVDEVLVDAAAQLVLALGSEGSMPASAVVGPYMTAKSAVIEIAARVLETSLVQTRVFRFRIVPSACASFSDALSSVLQHCSTIATLKQTDQHSICWIIIDGTMHESAVPALETVLASIDSPDLRRRLPVNTKIIFESESLSSMSPGLLVRCSAVIPMRPQNGPLPWQHLVHQFFRDGILVGNNSSPLLSPQASTTLSNFVVGILLDAQEGVKFEPVPSSQEADSNSRSAFNDSTPFVRTVQHFLDLSMTLLRHQSHALALFASRDHDLILKEALDSARASGVDTSDFDGVAPNARERSGDDALQAISMTEELRAFVSELQHDQQMQDHQEQFSDFSSIEPQQFVLDRIQNILFFALLWALGADISTSHRLAFSGWFRGLIIRSRPHQSSTPASGVSHSHAPSHGPPRTRRGKAPATHQRHSPTQESDDIGESRAPPVTTTIATSAVVVPPYLTDLPVDGNLFDYGLANVTLRWQLWSDRALPQHVYGNVSDAIHALQSEDNEFKYPMALRRQTWSSDHPLVHPAAASKPPSKSEFSLFIPTASWCRADFFVNVFIEQRRAFAAVGPAGLCKSATVRARAASNAKLIRIRCNSRTTLTHLVDSAQTMATDKCNFVIEDVHMAAPAAVSDISEFARQWALGSVHQCGPFSGGDVLCSGAPGFLANASGAGGGWFQHLAPYSWQFAPLALLVMVVNNQHSSFSKIMNPRTARRLMRVEFSEYVDEDIKRIYGTIIGGVIAAHTGSKELSKLGVALAAVGSETLTRVRDIVDRVLPVMAISQYAPSSVPPSLRFDVRQLLKVASVLSAASTAQIISCGSVVRMWRHTVSRVFEDALLPFIARLSVGTVSTSLLLVSASTSATNKNSLVKKKSMAPSAASAVPAASGDAPGSKISDTPAGVVSLPLLSPSLVNSHTDRFNLSAFNVASSTMIGSLAAAAFRALPELRDAINEICAPGAVDVGFFEQQLDFEDAFEQVPRKALPTLLALPHVGGIEKFVRVSKASETSQTKSTRGGGPKVLRQSSSQSVGEQQAVDMDTDSAPNNQDSQSASGETPSAPPTSSIGMTEHANNRSMLQSIVLTTRTLTAALTAIKPGPLGVVFSAAARRLLWSWHLHWHGASLPHDTVPSLVAQVLSIKTLSSEEEAVLGGGTGDGNLQAIPAESDAVLFLPFAVFALDGMLCEHLSKTELPLCQEIASADSFLQWLTRSALPRFNRESCGLDFISHSALGLSDTFHGVHSNDIRSICKSTALEFARLSHALCAPHRSNMIISGTDSLGSSTSESRARVLVRLISSAMRWNMIEVGGRGFTPPVIPTTLTIPVQETRSASAMSNDSRTSTPAPTDAAVAQQSYDQLKAKFFAQRGDVCFALRCILRAQWSAGVENKPTVLMISDQECDQLPNSDAVWHSVESITRIGVDDTLYPIEQREMLGNAISLLDACHSIQANSSASFDRFLDQCISNLRVVVYSNAQTRHIESTNSDLQIHEKRSANNSFSLGTLAPSIWSNASHFALRGRTLNEGITSSLHLWRTLSDPNDDKSVPPPHAASEYSSNDENVVNTILTQDSYEEPAVGRAQACVLIHRLCLQWLHQCCATADNLNSASAQSPDHILGIDEISFDEFVRLAINMYRRRTHQLANLIKRYQPSITLRDGAIAEIPRVQSQLDILRDHANSIRVTMAEKNQLVLRQQIDADQMLRDLRAKVAARAEKQSEHQKVLKEMESAAAVIGARASLERAREKMASVISDSGAVAELKGLLSMTSSMLGSSDSFKPHPSLLAVIQAACAVLNISPVHRNGHDDYFGPAREALVSLNFLHCLIDPDFQPPAPRFVAIENVIFSQSFNAETAGRISRALEAIAVMITALYHQHRAMVSLALLNERYEQLQRDIELDGLLNASAERTAHEMHVTVASTRAERDNADSELKKLDSEIDEKVARIERLNQLIECSTEIQQRYLDIKHQVAFNGSDTRAGDVLLAAAQTCYLCRIPIAARHDATKEVRDLLATLYLCPSPAYSISDAIEVGEPSTSDATSTPPLQEQDSTIFRHTVGAVKVVLDDAVALRTTSSGSARLRSAFWRSGLEGDSASMSLVSIMEHTPRWPFLIDPHGLMEPWMQLRRHYEVFDISQDNFVQQIELAKSKHLNLVVRIDVNSEWQLGTLELSSRLAFFCDEIVSVKSQSAASASCFAIWCLHQSPLAFSFRLASKFTPVYGPCAGGSGGTVLDTFVQEHISSRMAEQEMPQVCEQIRAARRQRVVVTHDLDIMLVRLCGMFARMTDFKTEVDSVSTLNSTASLMRIVSKRAHETGLELSRLTRKTQVFSTSVGSLVQLFEVVYDLNRAVPSRLQHLQWSHGDSHHFSSETISQILPGICSLDFFIKRTLQFLTALRIKQAKKDEIIKINKRASILVVAAPSITKGKPLPAPVPPVSSISKPMSRQISMGITMVNKNAFSVKTSVARPVAQSVASAAVGPDPENPDSVDDKDDTKNELSHLDSFVSLAPAAMFAQIVRPSLPLTVIMQMLFTWSIRCSGVTCSPALAHWLCSLVHVHVRWRLDCHESETMALLEAAAPSGAVMSDWISFSHRNSPLIDELNMDPDLIIPKDILAWWKPFAVDSVASSVAPTKSDATTSKSAQSMQSIVSGGAAAAFAARVTGATAKPAVAVNTTSNTTSNKNDFLSTVSSDSNVQAQLRLLPRLALLEKQFSAFQGLMIDMHDHPEVWRQWMEREDGSLPEPWCSKLLPLYQLLLLFLFSHSAALTCLRTFLVRTDCLPMGVANVALELDYSESIASVVNNTSSNDSALLTSAAVAAATQHFKIRNFRDAFTHSDCRTPILCLQGHEKYAALDDTCFAQCNSIVDDLNLLHQRTIPAFRLQERVCHVVIDANSQNDAHLSTISNAMQSGQWIFVTNFHLLPALVQSSIRQLYRNDMSPNFRLWILTASQFAFGANSDSTTCVSRWWWENSLKVRCTQRPEVVATIPGLPAYDDVRALTLHSMNRLDQESDFLSGSMEPSNSNVGPETTFQLTTKTLQILPHAQLFRKVALAIVFCHSTLMHCQINNIWPVRSQPPVEKPLMTSLMQSISMRSMLDSPSSNNSSESNSLSSSPVVGNSLIGTHRSPHAVHPSLMPANVAQSPPTPPESPLAVLPHKPSAEFQKPAFQRRNTQMIAAMMGAGSSARGSTLFGSGSSKKQLTSNVRATVRVVAATETKSSTSPIGSLSTDLLREDRGSVVSSSFDCNLHTGSANWSWLELITAMHEARRLWMEHVPVLGGDRTTAAKISSQLPWYEFAHAIGDGVYSAGVSDPVHKHMALAIFCKYLCADMCRDDFSFPGLGPLPFGNQTSLSQSLQWLHLLHFQAQFYVESSNDHRVSLTGNMQRRSSTPAISGRGSGAGSSNRLQLQRPSIVQATASSAALVQKVSAQPRRLGGSADKPSPDVALTVAHVARISAEASRTSPLDFLLPPHEAGPLTDHSYTPLQADGLILYLSRATVRHFLSRAQAHSALPFLFLLDRTRVHTLTEVSFSAPWHACSNMCWWCLHIHGSGQANQHGGVTDPQRRAQELAATRRAVALVKSQQAVAEVAAGAAVAAETDDLTDIFGAATLAQIPEV